MRRILALSGWAGLVAVLALALLNLTRWPAPWFDEGIHLHVPEALARFGAYADFSSEGLRHFGPTQAVGPTVMLPIAAVFKLFGVGLLQARLVMAAFLVALAFVAFRLARSLSGRVGALVALALLFSSPGPSVVEYGRQGLGEVPGSMFLLLGLHVWFRAWGTPTLAHLTAAGILLGLAAITKPIYLLALAPALPTAWALDIVYYRRLSHRVFLVTGIICALMFAAWQVVMLGGLSPGGLAENWALQRRTAEGAAFVFDAGISRTSLLQLMGVQGYFGLLAPAVLYTAWRARRRTLLDQKWCVVGLVAVANLGWFVLASNGWTRYAFVGLVPSALLVGRLWRDLYRGVSRSATTLRPGNSPARVALGAWLIVLVALPLSGTAARLIAPPDADAPTTAAWLSTHVPAHAIIETWEPELEVFTDHRYHYPPPDLLMRAVAHITRGAASPSTFYRFTDAGSPEYVVVGAFARWVGLYADDLLEPQYDLVHRQGAYAVWRRTPPAP